MKKETRNEVKKEMKERINTFQQMVGFFCEVLIDCGLVDSNVGVFVANGHVIACDPWEVIIDDQLGEDQVGCHFALPK